MSDLQVTEVNDINGDVVRVGDHIAAAFRAGDVAQLRTGLVLGFGERANKLTIKVKWEIESGGYRGPRASSTVGAIEADLKRFVRLEA